MKEIISQVLTSKAVRNTAALSAFAVTTTSGLTWGVA